jgi:hypothetical protein
MRIGVWKSEEGGMKMLKKKKRELSKNIFLLTGLLTIFFAMPLWAAESVKIKLPDGLYFYDSSVESLKDGRERIEFKEYIIVQNNIIYSSREAIKKFGLSEINRLFIENQIYKILLRGENIGKIFNIKVKKNGYISYEEQLFIKKVKEGPLYGKYHSSAVRCIAVPEKYIESHTKVFDIITKEEIHKISKLVKDKLFTLVKNRKEFMQYKVTELFEENLKVLDKVLHQNNELYIGEYWYYFKTDKSINGLKIVDDIPIIFSVKKDNVYAITSSYDDETLNIGEMSICGMLDVDNCGYDELIIQKYFGSLDAPTIHMEIFKQKTDGNWIRVKKISWRSGL